MDIECSRVTKVIMPAIRASVSEKMVRLHSYSQERIARVLGVDQVAVSKYLNKRYSKEVGRVRSYIVKRGLESGIVGKMAKGNGIETINKEINTLCAKILKEEMKVVN